MRPSDSRLLVTFYGVRGSAPAYKNPGTAYGAHTSCLLVRAGGRTIVIDGGTGAFRLGDELADESGDIDLLISHTHIDHIQGLPFFAPLFQPGRRIDIYGEDRDGMGIREQLDLFTGPPLWPVKVSTFAANIAWHAIEVGKPFALGEVAVETMRSNHPNTVTLFRLSFGGKSLVYGLDYEHTEDRCADLAAFAKDADLLVFDAAYSDAEYASKQGWGHSTWQKGLELAERGVAKRVALCHLAHNKTDDDLRALEKSLAHSQGRCFVAREGMELRL